MAITIDDFSKIWASTSPLTPYTFSESNYKEGWNFVGNTPPSRQMWDFLQKNNDEKMKYLADNYLALSGGTIIGDLEVTGNLTQGGKEVERVNASGTDYIRYESGLQICWGTVSGSGNSDGSKVTFPVAFNASPMVNATAYSLTATTNHVSVQIGTISTTGCWVAVSVGTTWTSSSLAARYIAIGYWK